MNATTEANLMWLR